MQEKVDTDSQVDLDFIESLFNYVCCDEPIQEVIYSDEVDEVCGSVVSAKKVCKFSCEACGKSFKDNNHLTEHRDRLHSDPASCVVCEVVFPDKFSAICHQKTCMRKCPYQHCDYQNKHKHRFLKHIRGHERQLRRF